MRHFVLLPLAASLLLVACGESGTADADGDGEVSNQEMLAENASAGDAIKPQAGQYRATMTVQRAEIPGMPPEMMDMMGSQMNRTFEYCLTPEEADRGFEESLAEGQDENCTMQNYDISGGHVEMAMTCANAGTGDIRMTMSGDVSPTRSDITMQMRGDMTGAGEANIEMNMVQERIGDCAG